MKEEQTQLIADAKRNDRRAQKKLYDAYAPAMMSVCRLYIQDIHFAEDVLLKSFFKIFTNLKGYDERDQLYAWMRKIVRNECIDFLRSRTHKMVFSEWNEVEESVEIPSIHNTDCEALQFIIDQLPSGCKAVFNLYVFEDFGHQEIAEKLGISVGTSKSQLSYAKKVLKEKLDKAFYYAK